MDRCTVARVKAHILGHAQDLHVVNSIGFPKGSLEGWLRRQFEALELEYPELRMRAGRGSPGEPGH